MRNIYISSCHKNGGIYRYELKEGRLIFKDKTDLDRPMYTTVHNKKLYVILREAFENGDSGIVSLNISDGGSLSNLSSPISTGGKVCCHLCVKDNDVFSTNYISGSINKLGQKTVIHSGSGPNLPRQDKAHCHFIKPSPDGKYILVCDLGLDTIFTYDTDLNVISAEKVPDGHGVRHLAYSQDGKTVYAVNELAATVSVLDYSDGKLTLLDTVETLPEDCTEKNTAAAIRVYGNRLYVSNRAQSLVAVMDISNRIPKLIKQISTDGISPRDFDIIDNTMICTNEGGNITVYNVEGDNFTLTQNIPCEAVLCVDC